MQPARSAQAKSLSLITDTCNSQHGWSHNFECRLMAELNKDPKYLDDKPLLRILILTVVSRQFFRHQQKFCKKMERFGWKFTETVAKVKCHHCNGTGSVVSGQHNLKCYGCDNGIETLTDCTVLWNNRPVTMDDN